MSNFTGTNWICEKNGNGDFFIDSSRGESIGILYNDVPEVEANARLIAAAPDMYRFLTEVVKFYLPRIRKLVFRDGKTVDIGNIEKLLEWVDDNDNE